MFESETKIYKIKKKFKKNKILIFSMLLCSFLVFFDQFIKNLIIKNLNLQESFTLIRSVVKLTYVKNYGAAFSILFNKTKFLIFFTILVIAIFLIYIIKNKVKDKIYIFSVSMIVSGGIGNLIDRIEKGYVIDYINLIFWPFEKFAVFNFADCLIVLGCVIFLLKFIKNEFFVCNMKKIKKL